MSYFPLHRIFKLRVLKVTRLTVWTRLPPPFPKKVLSSSPVFSNAFPLFNKARCRLLIKSVSRQHTQRHFGRIPVNDFSLLKKFRVDPLLFQSRLFPLLEHRAGHFFFARCPGIATTIVICGLFCAATQNACNPERAWTWSATTRTLFRPMKYGMRF